MASPPSASPAKGKPLTTANIVAIQKERAFRLGEAGFTTNFPDFDEIANAYRLSNTTEGQSIPNIIFSQDNNAVEGAMQSTRDSIHQLNRNEKLLKNNRPLVEQTEAEIDSILLKAGRSKRYVAGQDLRKKITEAVELKNPKPARNYFTVYISDPSTGIGIEKDRLLAVNLPLRESLDEVYKLLKDIVRAEVIARFDTTGEDPAAVAHNQVVWKYQLLSKDFSKTLRDKSALLETDSDLGRLRKAVKSGLVAVLARDDLRVPSASAINITEELGLLDEELLDEGGQPYFEPLDWDMLTKKYAHEWAAGILPKEEVSTTVSHEG